MLNIVCTAKPCDGLLYYSYEYCIYLNSINIPTHLIIVSHPNFKEKDYFNSLTEKYSSYNYTIVDDIAYDGVALIMGRSMLTHAFMNRNVYNMDQLLLLHMLFKEKLISVYSENHPVEYMDAINYFCPNEVIDLCDYGVYPNGVGKHFEKKINFDIYRPLINETQFEHLFNGTNVNYYKAAKSVMKKYPDHGIMIYDVSVVDYRFNNIFVPVENLLGKFNTYVYTKDTLDPAPRLIQECKYYNKEIIFEANNRGAKVYFERPIEKPDVEVIVNEL